MLSIKKLSYSYDKKNNNSIVLNNVNLNFLEGKFYAILGNNGCGKSTLLKCIDRICRTQSIFLSRKLLISSDKDDHYFWEKNITSKLNEDSQIYVNINDISSKLLAKIISYCPQNNNANSLNVQDFVSLGRKPYFSFNLSDMDKIIVSDTINNFKLSNFAKKPVNKLSGGEFQRSVLARTFVQNSNIMLLDEPTNNLDVLHQHMLMHMLQNYSNKKNCCVICVMHDINMAITHADEIIFMKDGKVLHKGSPKDIDSTILKTVYDLNANVFNLNGYKAVFI